MQSSRQKHTQFAMIKRLNLNEQIKTHRTIDFSSSEDLKLKFVDTNREDKPYSI